MESKFKIDDDYYISIEQYYFVMHQRSTGRRWLRKYLHKCLWIYIERKVINTDNEKQALETIIKVRDELQDFIKDFAKHKANYYVKDGVVVDNNNNKEKTEE